jgi:O-antigen/teichoic acid export membrane protein
MEMREAILGRQHKDEAPVQWLHWGHRALFAILDQGLFAGSSFAVNILLARWVSPESYGAFAIAYSGFLLLGTLHTAILTTPLLVFGGGEYSEEFGKYLRLLLFVHIGLTAAMSVILAGAAAILSWIGSAAVAQAFLGLAPATPFILFICLLRAACYARLRPQWAAASGALYFLMLAAGLYGVYRSHLLSPATAFAVMAVGGLIAGFWLLMLLDPRWWVGLKFPRVYRVRATLRLLRVITDGYVSPQATVERQDRWEPARALHDHFRFAKWQSASSTTAWLASNLHYFVLSSIAGLGTVAVMRVLDTMLVPYFHYQTALARLITPVLARRARNPRSELVPYATRIILLWTSQAVIAYIVLRVFAGDVMSLLYGGAYSRYRDLLAWYGLVVVPGAISEVLLDLLQVMVRTDLIFLFQLVSSGCLLVGFLLAAKHGLPGIVSVLILVSFAVLPLQMVATHLVLRKAPDRAEAYQPATRL